MDKQYLIKLTSTVYEMSKWWPENNLLKFKITNLANEILVDFILISYQNPGLDIQEQIFNNIQALEQALQISRKQKLLDRNDFLLLKREYKTVRQAIKSQKSEKIVKGADKPLSKPKLELEIETKQIVFPDLNSRQKKIIEILRQREKTQVSDLKQIFTNISKRTLRRDLEDLLNRNLVQRAGEWNKIFYVSTPY